MKFKKLGNTDLNVSLICLGTMTWGEQNNQEEAFEQMDYALDQGVNFFDTAEMYAIPPSEKNFGTTETIIGNWFIKRNNREKVDTWWWSSVYKRKYYNCTRRKFKENED